MSLLSFPSFLKIPSSQTPKTPKPPNSHQSLHLNANGREPTYQTERGLRFETEGAFFRHESATGRDLGVLSAALYKLSRRELRVLDAMCGCGVRSLRYLEEAEADFVVANDANDYHRRVILGNLKSVKNRGFGENRRWVVTHVDANRILSDCYLNGDFYDLIDVDSFGSDSSFIRTVFNAIRRGGLLYLTSTDGYSSGGHRPYKWCCTGSLCTRVMLRVNRGTLLENKDYGFISYCNECGTSQSYSWEELGQIGCPCSNTIGSSSLVVSGPLWIGPLHDATHLTEMLNLAEQWGWVGNDMGTDLEKLLNRMLDESNPRLPSGYIKLDEVASRAKINSPRLNAMISAVQKEGYAASRSHIASNAIKTNCPMMVCIRIAKELQGLPKN